ncbi:integrase, partial [Pseudomonas syringae]|uniref:DUF6538 domain-containing protein n=1 Tax=Pseudomonas syringae TaxID=317 RepID=UPI00359CB84C|nr:integrase [Pseudomonas syringae]
MSHNLELQGGTFHVRLAVPKDVQKAFDGRKILSRSLGTGSRKEAMERRLPILHTWKAKIKAARSGNPLPQDWQDSFAVSLEAVDSVTKWSKAARIGLDIPLPVPIPSQAEMQEFMGENEELMRVLKGEVQNASQVPMGQFKLSDKLGEVFKYALAQRYETRYTPTADQRDEIKAITAGDCIRKPRSPITTARLKTFRGFRESRGGAAKHIDQQVGKMERLSDFLKKDGLPLTFDTIDGWLKSLNR